MASLPKRSIAASIAGRVVALIVVIICSLYKKVNPTIIKVLAIAFIVITVAQAVINILVNPDFELHMITTLIRSVCNGIAWFIVYLGIKQEEFTKINFVKLIVAVLIVAVANFALTSVLKGTNSSSSNGCGHPECKENGPFPCYGKNNTCTNKTYCYQDMYCDECD